MVTIKLFCASGMSTSVLVNKMKINLQILTKEILLIYYYKIKFNISIYLELIIN